MWEWLMQKVNDIVRRTYRNGSIRSVMQDDIVQEMMLYLLQNKELAESIYQEQKYAALYTIVKRQISEMKSRESFRSHDERSRYYLIKAVCEEYEIEPVPQNAFKVWAMIQNKPNISRTSKEKIFTISYIEKMLSFGDAEIKEVPLPEQ